VAKVVNPPEQHMSRMGEQRQTSPTSRCTSKDDPFVVNEISSANMNDSFGAILNVYNTPSSFEIVPCYGEERIKLDSV
jgi:hypothetical protein